MVDVKRVKYPQNVYLKLFGDTFGLSESEMRYSLYFVLKENNGVWYHDIGMPNIRYWEKDVFLKRFKDCMTFEEIDKAVNLAYSARTFVERVLKKIRNSDVAVAILKIGVSKYREYLIYTLVKTLDLVHSKIKELNEMTGGELVPIEKLGLAIRSRNCLKRRGVDYVNQLLCLSREYLLRMHSIGKTHYYDIILSVYDHGYKFLSNVHEDYLQMTEYDKEKWRSMKVPAKYFCDICHEEIPSEKSNRRVLAVSYNNQFKKSDVSIVKLDLCDTCYEKCTNVVIDGDNVMFKDRGESKCLNT